MKQLSGEQMFSSALRCHGALLCIGVHLAAMDY